MRKRSLLDKSMTQFSVCLLILFVLAAPAFYWLTKSFYAEDMIDIIEAVQAGHPIPKPDLEKDIFIGIMIQYGVIVVVFGLAVLLVMRFVSKRLWISFDRTLDRIENFRLEEGRVPDLPTSDIKEFDRLNTALNGLMTNSLNSYRIQKEFTENASNELQTPLAIFRSKLELLLQQPNITEEQARIMQDFFDMTNRLARLNRNLLLLAKMENSQFHDEEPIDVVEAVCQLVPSLESLANDIAIHVEAEVKEKVVKADRSLFESMLNNLIVNAIRHNIPHGEILIEITDRQLVVSNSSGQGPLDGSQIFNRFYRPENQVQGNGLGLAIVKSVCGYHHWQINYQYEDEKHNFIVTF